VSALVCPYCDKECEADCESNEPDRVYEHECENCEKNFVYTLDYTVHYSEQQAPCLNGAEHEWVPVRGWPERAFAGKQRCQHCDKRREVKP